MIQWWPRTVDTRQGRDRMSTTEHTEAVLVAALGSGASYQRAAEIAGVGKATVTRRMADAGFRARVDVLRRDHVRRVEIRLGDLSCLAIDTLEELLVDTDIPAHRLGAAKAILAGLLRFREAGEVEQRLAVLETRLALNGHAPPIRHADRTDRTPDAVGL